MTDSEVDYFKKVPNSEKKSVFKSVIDEKYILTFKPEEQDELLSYQALQFIENKLLLKVVAGSEKLLKTQSCFINFLIGEDRYYFQTLAKPQGKTNDGCLISIDVDLFVLQRRKSMRIRIPKTYPAFFNIIRKDEKAALGEGVIIDFSSGGVRVVMKSAIIDLKIGDLVRAVLHLNHRRPIEIDLLVRHVFPQSDGSLQYGGQFQNLNSMLENRLLILNMDLHREIFLKFSNKG